MGLLEYGTAALKRCLLFPILAAILLTMLPVEAASQAYVDLVGEVATYQEGRLTSMSGPIATIVYAPNGTPLAAFYTDGSPPRALTCTTNNPFTNMCRTGDGELLAIPTPATVTTIFAISNPELAVRQARDGASRAAVREATRSTTAQTQRGACQAIAGFVGGRVDDILAPRPGARSRSTEAERGAPSEALATRYAPGGVAVAAARSFAEALNGLSASGGSSGNWAAWADGSVSFLADGASGRRFSGSLWSGMVGIDSRVLPNLVLGVAGGYESAALDTCFNNGSTGTHGWTTAPYLGWGILDNLTLDLLGAFTFLDSRADMAYGAGRSGSPFRVMASANLNAYHAIENWRFKATAGYMHSSQTGNVGLSTDDTVIGELRAGLTVSYFFGKAFEPYLAGAFLHDVQLSGDGNPNMLEARIGFAVRPAAALRCGFEVSNLFTWNNTRDTRLMLNLRYAF